MTERFRKVRSVRGWLPAAAFLLYAVLLAHYMGAYAGGSDSSGYLNNARLLSEGRIIAPMRLVPGLEPRTLPPYTHVPLGFIPNPDHVTMTPTYPMGLPLLLASMAAVTGWVLAPGLVIGLHALLGLWLVYLLAREVGLEPGWARLGVLALAASPLYFGMSLQMMSDVPALVWVVAAVWCALRSRSRSGMAGMAGMALAVAVLVRPTNLLAVAPVAIALGFSLRRWLLLILGGMPGAVLLGIINHAAYHRIFTTGYGDVAGIFGAQYVPVTLIFYLAWLPMVLTPLVFLAAGIPLLFRRQRGMVVMLAAWILVFLVFYLFYRHTHEMWWYLRFLLPAFPALIVAALLVARALTGKLRMAPSPRGLAVAGLLILIYSVAWCRHYYVHHVGSGEAVYPLTAAWSRENLPSAAVVAAMQTSGALFYYTDLTILRWDLIGPDDFRRIAAACRTAGRPLYAVLFPNEIEEDNAFTEHLPGTWTKIGAVRQVTVWRYDSPTPP